MSDKVNKFKVGDKIVRVSAAWSEMPLGSVWKVSSVINSKEIQVFGVDDMDWLSDHFELVNEGTNASQNESIDQFFESDVILPKNDEDDFTCCLGKGIESKLYNPLVAQEGGGHYKNRGIQPIEYSHANSLSASQHSVVKYITRYYDKGGIEDLSKIVHFVLLEAYFRYGEQGSTELKDKILTILGENKES